MRVLIADDQPQAAQLLAELVQQCRHEVVAIVDSGLAAIDAYAQYRPDVVLMDYWMSKLNGATACRNILAKDPLARVIFVSGGAPASALLELGALRVLTKPVHLNQLYEALYDAVPQPAVNESAEISFMAPDFQENKNPLEHLLRSSG